MLCPGLSGLLDKTNLVQNTNPARWDESSGHLNFCHMTLLLFMCRHAIISMGQNHNGSRPEITSVNGVCPFGNYVRIQSV